METTASAVTVQKPQRHRLAFLAHQIQVKLQQRQAQADRARARQTTMTTEIPQKFWEAFCKQLKDWYRGAVSIRWIQPGGDERIVAENIPLQTFAFQKRAKACSDMMTVEAGESGKHPLQYQIIEPFRVVLRKDDESGRYHELEILAETGKTEITFTPSIDATVVEKLAA